MKWGLAIVLAGGLGARLWGIGQGYPEFYGHVDEIGVAASIWNFFRAGTLQPTEFTYPAFFSYLVAAGLWLCGAVGMAPRAGGLMDSLVLQSFLDPAWAALVGRGLSAALATATLWLTWLLGREAFTPRVGALAVLLVAFARVPVEQAHRALPDSAMAFLAVLCCYFSWKIYCRGAWRDYLLAGALAGLVVATKYNGAFTALAAVAAHALRRERRWALSGKMWAAGGCGAAALLAGSPYLVLAGQRYLELARYQMSSLDFALKETTPWWWIVRQLVQVEMAVGALMVVGMGWAVFRRHPLDWLFLAAWVPSFLYIGSWTRESLHYLLHLYPLLAIGVASAVEETAQFLRERFRFAWAVYLLVGAGSLPSIHAAVEQGRDLGRTDTRALAAAWIERHLPAGTRLAMTWLPYCPRLELLAVRQSVKEYYRERPEILERLEQAWGGRPAYQLVNMEIWLKQPVVPQAYAGTVDLEDPETRRVFSRGWRSLRQLRELGVEYAVLPGAIYGRYLEGVSPAEGTAAHYHYAKNRAYFEQFTQPADAQVVRVAEFSAGLRARGGSIYIYRLLP